jgi:chitin synthase
MYLAEDRILCFELVARERCAWKLKYVKNAVAETDVPETLEDLMKQRRRWLNGSTFALAFSVYNFHRIFGTSHSNMRKVFLLTQLLYYAVQLVLTWFLPAVFLLSWRLLLEEHVAQDDSLFSRFLNALFGDLFSFMVIFQFIVAIANKVQDQKDFYTFTRMYFGLIAILNTVLLIQQMASSCDAVLQWSAIATSTFLFVCAFFHGELYTVLTTWVQYLSMVPVYLLAMQIYAICNTHDLSWGTKGLEAGGHGGGAAASSTADALKNADKLRKQRELALLTAKAKEDHLKSFRFWASLFLLGCNMVLVLLVTTVTVAREGFFRALFGVLLVVTSYRFIGSTIYMTSIWRQKLGRWTTMFSQWISSLPQIPFDKYVDSDHIGFKPRVFHNAAYGGSSLEAHKFPRTPVPIFTCCVLDRNTVADPSKLQPALRAVVDLESTTNPNHLSRTTFVFGS